MNMLYAFVYALSEKTNLTEAQIRSICNLALDAKAELDKKGEADPSLGTMEHVALALKLTRITNKAEAFREAARKL